MFFRWFFALIVFPAAAFAQDGRRILVYPTRSAVSYTEKAGGRGCTLGLGESQSARIVAETATDIEVVFDTDELKGCFGDTLFGRDLKRGWLKKSEVTYADAEDGGWKPKQEPPGCECEASPLDRANHENLKDVQDLVERLKSEDSGMKTVDQIEDYLRCYPKSEAGPAAAAKYKPFMDHIVKNFELQSGPRTMNVDSKLFRCLIRRESGYLPGNVSDGNAIGLGQHTSINIRHIRNRLATKSSWESKIWKKFFADMAQTPEGRRELAACPGSVKKGEPPVFKSGADAACPLQSLAASAIYNLQIQQAFQRSAGLKGVDWEHELDYQLAIGAAYNLGDGAAAAAVDDLVLGGWADSIRNKSPSKDKRKEVAGHIDALRNCMEAGNWKPMHKNDTPQCADFAELKARK